MSLHELRVDEAVLTGESVPVPKETAAQVGTDLPLADRRNMAYKGTVVLAGTPLTARDGSWWDRASLPRPRDRLASSFAKRTSGRRRRPSRADDDSGGIDGGASSGRARRDDAADS